MYLQHKMPWTARLPRFVRDLLDKPGLLRWSAKQGDLTDAEKHADMTIAMLRADESTLAREVDRFVKSMQLQETPDVIILCNMLLAGLARPLAD